MHPSALSSPTTARFTTTASCARARATFGVVFRTTCDTEILPYAYLAWGDAMFERLEGLFAIGLWDRQERRLLLARDGIGMKPLYYAERSRRVLLQARSRP